MPSSTFYPIVSSDDGYVITDGSFNNSANDLFVEYGGAEDKHLFVRFPNVTIPPYSVINSASLILTVFIYESGTVVTTRIKFEKETDAVAVTSYANFNAKNRTTAYVNWEFDKAVTGDWSTTGGTMVPVESGDIKTVIQEVVDQAGWLRGNAMQLLLEAIADNASVNFNAVDYSYDAELHVDWNEDAVVDMEGYDVSLEATATFPTMSFIAEDYAPITIQDVFANSRQEYFEYELLTLQSGVYKHSKYLTTIESGSISINFDRDIIGNAKFKLKEKETIDYLSDVIKPWICKIYEGSVYKYPLGVYMLNYPGKYSDGLKVTRDVNTFDFTLALKQDEFTYPVSYPAGTNVVAKVEEILASVGTWVNYYIQPSDEELSEDMTYAIGKSKLFVINSLLNTINYVPIFCTGNGVFRSMPWSESNNILWDFQDNEDSLYASGITVVNDYASIYNKVVIITNQLQADTAPLTATLTFEDMGLSAHPLSATSLGRTITEVFNSDATSQDYVDLRARRELLKMLEISQTISKRHLFVTTRNDGLPYSGDCFRFKNTLLEIDSVFKIASMSFDLKVGRLANSTISKVVTTY